MYGQPWAKAGKKERAVEEAIFWQCCVPLGMPFAAAVCQELRALRFSET